jgi:hypothetical protein
MDQNSIDKFEKTQAQLGGLYEEIGLLSKKKPNDGINKFKLKFVNSVLKETNALLGKKYKPFADFGLFEQDNIPTNSDVMMILAQYLNCMEKLRADNIKKVGFNNWEWHINNNKTGIKTSPPKKLSER